MVWDKSKGWVGGGGGVCGVGKCWVGGGDNSSGWVCGGGGWGGLIFPEIFPGRYSNSKLPIWPPHVFGTNARVRMRVHAYARHTVEEKMCTGCGIKNIVKNTKIRP